MDFELVGSGAYGNVYLTGENTVTKRQRESDSAYRELLMYNMLEHSNIPVISNVKKSAGYIYFDMERLVCIEDIVSELNMVEKHKIFKELVGLVEYLAYKGVYHQDIRPSNILFDPETKKPYLIDYGFANSDFTVRGCWTDPKVSEYFYINIKTPPKEMFIAGDIWSLGLFGVWLFVDQDIYEWVRGFDDECMDIIYVLKGRFGNGLRSAHLDLDGLDEELVNNLDGLMSSDICKRLEALDNIYQVTLKDMEIWDYPVVMPNDIKEYVYNQYGLDNMEIYDKDSAIIVIKDILYRIEHSRKPEKIKLLYQLYDDVLPKCYQDINNQKFWTTCVDKLIEINNDSEVDISDLYERRIDEVKNL